MEEIAEITEISINRLTPEEKTSKKEPVVREVPFTIIINGKELATLLCTPSGLTHLTMGFLLSEGLIHNKEDIKQMVLNEKGWYIQIYTNNSLIAPEALVSKRLIGSGCAGAVSFYRSLDAQHTTPVDSPFQIPRDRVFVLIKEFQQKSCLYRQTGGVHSCALATPERIEVFAEDIGRHNAVDKVFGECLLKDISTQNKILLTSGRITSEILIKTAKRQVPIIISPSAPTDLAIGLARKLKLTIIGFVRGKRLNVYSQPQRIT